MAIEHHHDLAKEFPEFKDRVHDLKQSSPEFAALYQEFQDVDKEIFRIEEEIETPGDAFIEDLKKKRLALKDRLYQLLRQG